MLVFDAIFNIIAPYECISCNREGFVVCSWCINDIVDVVPSRCYSCHALSKEYKTCLACRRKSKLSNVWVRTEYQDKAKQLVNTMKFERVKAATEIVARLLTDALPYVPKDTIIVHIPTATSRRRQRGYDQAEQIAKELSKLIGVKHKRLLLRLGQTRQVGSKRSDRLEQLRGAFRCANKSTAEGVNILLVDDVITTGATLEAAAKTLRQAGAKHVSAVVFAQAK